MMAAPWCQGYQYRSEPGGEDDRAEVFAGVLADAVERAGGHPQDQPPQVVRVPLDLGVEVAERVVLGPQQLVGVVQVLPGLFDRPLRVVVELPVLVPAHDMPGPERLDLTDRLPPGSE